MKVQTVNQSIPLLAAAFAGILLVACGKYYVDESPGESVTLDAGTELTVSPTSDLSPLDENAGEEFAAVLAAPIVSEGRVVAPKGAPVRGEVVLTASPDEASGRIAFRLRELTVHGGNEISIDTDTVYKFSPVPDPGDPTRAPVVTEADTLLFKLANPVTFSFTPDESLGSL